MKLLQYILIGVLALTLGLLGKVGCQNTELQTSNDKLNRELMQADLDKGRSLTKFGDAGDYIDQLEEKIQDDIKEREGELQLYAELQTEYNLVRKKLKAGKTQVVYIKGETVEVPASLDLVQGMYYEAVTVRTLVPIERLDGEFHDRRIDITGRVYPVPGHEMRFEFDYQLQMAFELQFVESHLPTGAINHYATMYEIDRVTGERLGKLPVTKFTVVVNKPEQGQWFWWAPHIDVGVLGMARFAPPAFSPGGSIGISLMGYGRTVNDLQWRVARLSFDLSDGLPGIGLTPVAYNLGELLPLISNLWVGPHLSYIPEQWGVGLLLGAVL